MTIRFKYSVVYDLVYHILAHMQVDNASNLFSEAYIDNVNRTKKGRYDSIAGAAAHLSDYYNENFERLGVINFLPVECSSVQDLIDALENYCAFTDADMEAFILPFNQLLKSEFEFYGDYWTKLHDATAVCRKAFESWIKNEMSKYEALFAYFNKSAVIGMSYSLTNNGRGYGSAVSFNAVVPFHFDKSNHKNTFYQVLHEYTHQFTDQLLGDNVSMDDGTHAIAEKAVILFDYYLIKRMNQEDVNSYLEWIDSLANGGHSDENLFLSAFRINDDVNEKLLALAEKITRG